MELQGEYRIEAPRETVWRALNDPDTLKKSIPGCESIEASGENEFSAKITAKVGPVKARFGGKVHLSDLDPPNGYTIAGEGAGGAAGFARGFAKVSLEDDDGATMLRYSADAQVGGKLAQIGSRLVKGSAQKTADDFFTKFSKIVSESAIASQGAAAFSPRPCEPAETRPAAETIGRSEGVPAWLWLAGAVAAVVALLAIFLR